MPVALTAFGDFVLSTAPKKMSGPNSLINEFTKAGYPEFEHGLRGRSEADSVQAGRHIFEHVFLDNTSTFRFVGPKSESSPTEMQVLSEAQAAWRFGQADMAWNDFIVELNEGDPEVQWTRVRNTITTKLWTDIINGMSDAFYVAPNKDTMEGLTQTAGEPYPIATWMNEQTNGLFNSVTTAGAGGAWTTIHGIASGTKTKWRCQAQGYGAGGAGFTVNNTANVFTAFDKIWLALRWKKPGTRDQYFEDDSLFRQVILASNDGISKYQALLRAQNELLVVAGRQDPAYDSPAYRGISMEHAPSLDAAVLYSKAGATTTLGTEATADSTGPRYYWPNFAYLRPFIHSKFYFKMLNEVQPESSVNDHWIPVQSWYNWFCTSVSRQGIVYPTADN